SRHNPAAAYLTVDFHQVNNRDPFVYKTTDYGKTWKAISAGIPRSMLSYAHCIREDPIRQGLLYLGTENALYVSFDDGESWQPLQTNLPHAPVYWMVIQEHFNDLVVGTYGRGFWILDDLSPLQQLTPRVRDSDAHLFTLRPTYRFRPITIPMSQSDDPTAGQNPPYGASINYYLKTVPAGDVTIRIQDPKGQLVRTLRGSKDVGINRMWWDLRGEQTKEIRLKTSPAYAPEVRVGPEGWRPLPEGGRMSVLVPPGTYTVKLTVGGQEFSQPLSIKKDPNSAATEADIQTQMEMLLDIRNDLETVADMTNQIEIVRSQLYDITALLQDHPNAAQLKSAGDELDKKLLDIEEHLIQRKLTGTGQDSVRWPAKLVSKINYLASGLSSSDFPPTSQQREVHKLFK
ncbi:MAG: sialidase, partial [Acidimicrobiia bacterium]